VTLLECAQASDFLTDRSHASTMAAASDAAARDGDSRADTRL
jgi:hypothetical protein